MLFEFTEVMPQRKRNGQFAKGNAISRAGGYARARSLSAKRRRQIAKRGWMGLVAKRFGGDQRAARRWWGAMGAWHYDQRLLETFGPIRPAFPHPGDPSTFRAKLYQTSLFDPLLREPDFYVAVSWNSDAENAT